MSDTPSVQPAGWTQHAVIGGLFETARTSGYVADEDERILGFYAHMFAALANIIFLGFFVPVVAPLAVLAMAKDRRPFALFHINQSMMLQSLLAAANTLVIVTVTVVARLETALLAYLVLPATLGTLMAVRAAFLARAGIWGGYPFIAGKLLQAKRPWIRP